MKPKTQRWMLGLTSGLAILLFLIFDLSPATHDQGQPSAADSAAAISALRRIRDHSGQAAPTDIFLSNEELNQALRLAARAAGFPRTTTTIQPEAITFQSSLDLPFGLWLNLSATAEPSDSGFPRVTGHLGRLPVPAIAMRMLIDVYLDRLRTKGIVIADPDTLIHGMEVVSTGVRAKIQLPPETTLFDVVNRDPAPRAERALVIAQYCRLAALQQTAPATDLSTLFRQSFSVEEKGASEDAANRARLVAVAMIVVSRDAGTLAGVKESAIADCPDAAGQVSLQGRVDLAQHLTLSAAIAVTVNQAFSRRLGVWKELADSNTGGTGFSFVDLSADRAGLVLAKRLSAPETASQTARRMQTIDEKQLLPIAALAFSEGLSEEQFRARYISPESKAYDDMVGRIDAVLAGTY